MITLTKLVKKENKPQESPRHPQNTLKDSQDLLRRARLIQRPLQMSELNVGPQSWNSTNLTRKASVNEIDTKPSLNSEKQSRKSSVEKRLEKPKNICSMINGQTLSFKIDITKLNRKEEGVNKQSFKYLYVIGKGGFGKVWWVESKKTGVRNALKEMKKSKIVAKKSIHSVMNERKLLANLSHHFIVNMSCAFQDRDNLYLVLDLLTGGDFRYHLGRKKVFRESEAKFYIGCIVLGLEYLHSQRIIHRDIKPENLVLDDKGYLKITDMGIAREAKPNNSADTSGTPGYMSPEVMCCQDHSYAADYYALGIILFEIIMGKRPYRGNSRKEIRDHMLSKQVQIKATELPEGWSPQAMSLTNKLIQRNPHNRLGNIRIGQIKEHEWFKGFSWISLNKRQLQSPFIPKAINNNHDYRQQISETTDEDVDAETLLLLKRKDVEELFDGYAFQPQQMCPSKREGIVVSSRQESSRVVSARMKTRTTSEVVKL